MSGGRALQSRQLTAPELRARVLAAVEREPTAPRPVVMRRHAARIGLGFAAALVVAGGRLIFGHASAAHGQPGAHPPWHVVAAGGMDGLRLGRYVSSLEALWGAIALAATWLAVTRGRSMLGRSRASKLLVATLTPLALIAAWLLVALTWLDVVIASAWLEVMNDSSNVPFDTSCLMISAVYAVGPLIGFLAIRRHRDPVSPRHAGAAMGAAAGAWGAVLHFPFCQCTLPLHLLVGHVAPVALMAVLGALAGERVLGLHAAAN